MPTRYLKPGIRDSDTLERIKNPDAEILYYRLLVTVDDFGRFDARPAVIKGLCFPLRVRATERRVDEWLGDLHASGAIFRYEHEGRPYLQITRWDNKPRASESKCPPPTADAYTLHANVCSPRTLLPVTVTGTETVTETDTMSGKPDVAQPKGKNGQHYLPIACGVLDFLNKKTGRHYQPVRANLKFIIARLKDGATADELRMVIEKKYRDWRSDDKMVMYLRPATLFNATKFAQYQGELTPSRPDDTTCKDDVAGQPCGMPGKVRGGGVYRCDHHELKREERLRAPRAPMPQAIRDLAKKQRERVA